MTALQEAVLQWSAAGGATGWRDLPWRRTRDPWAVLVSEMMLQQTQVARVIPRWQALLDLGAQHCTGRHPSCDGCPLRVTECAWARAGFPDPDPARGSARVSGRQSPFPGSDRQGRGRLVQALQIGPIPRWHWADAAGWPGDAARAARAASSLVADGLAVHVEDELRLPT